MSRLYKKRIRLISKIIHKIHKNTLSDYNYQVLISALSIPYLLWQVVVPIIPLGEIADRVSSVFKIILEKQKTKQILGLNLASILLIISLVPFTQIQADSFPTLDDTVLKSPNITILTEETFQMPVPGYVSQRFNWYHHGIDIAGNNGANIYPITNGVVKEISYSPLGYGLEVVVDHGNGIISRYAHLQTRYVKLDQKITKADVIGLVGATGWATGPHLHLEIYQNGRSINPFALVPATYSKDIRYVASNSISQVASNNYNEKNNIASVSAQIEFKEIATNFVDPNWTTEASQSATEENF